MQLRSGRIVFLNEIADDPASFVGSSVRVLGKLVSFDAADIRAVIEHKKCRLQVNMLDQFVWKRVLGTQVATQLLDGFSFKANAMFQFIGELEAVSSEREGKADACCEAKGSASGVRTISNLVLTARVSRSVEGLDMKLYEEAVKLRRVFEAQEERSSRGGAGEGQAG